MFISVSERNLKPLYYIKFTTTTTNEQTKDCLQVYIPVKLKLEFILFRFNIWSTTPWVIRVKWISSTGKKPPQPHVKLFHNYFPQGGKSSTILNNVIQAESKGLKNMRRQQSHIWRTFFWKEGQDCKATYSNSGLHCSKTLIKIPTHCTQGAHKVSMKQKTELQTIWNICLLSNALAPARANRFFA